MTNKETKTAREVAERLVCKWDNQHDVNAIGVVRLTELRDMIAEALEQAQQREPWPGKSDFERWAFERERHYWSFKWPHMNIANDVYQHLTKFAAPTVVVPSDEEIILEAQNIAGSFQSEYDMAIIKYGKTLTEHIIDFHKAALQSTQTISTADLIGGYVKFSSKTMKLLHPQRAVVDLKRARGTINNFQRATSEGAAIVKYLSKAIALLEPRGANKNKTGCAEELGLNE